MKKIYKFVFYLKRNKSGKITRLSIYSHDLEESKKILNAFLKTKKPYLSYLNAVRCEDADLTNKYFKRFNNTEEAVSRQYQVIKEFMI